MRPLETKQPHKAFLRHTAPPLHPPAPSPSLTLPAILTLSPPPAVPAVSHRRECVDDEDDEQELSGWKGKGHLCDLAALLVRHQDLGGRDEVWSDCTRIAHEVGNMIGDKGVEPWLRWE